MLIAIKTLIGTILNYDGDVISSSVMFYSENHIVAFCFFLQ